ncbi:hypothetical protein DAPPUDRAFT_234289 [Daphnia pulex]|uniref:Uncharacterized protein n=1 Tax=Daphnia pulex TaxID=6669 RepID=E9FY17_DAPPU|nr:hypothetical protein DAPPUDRAFT_234289 [Daphnia pulex]|eukprot:EFX88473.1 hypothetical protein DAPPUDRAFT_234289 [Daphnia pulex]
MEWRLESMESCDTCDKRILEAWKIWKPYGYCYCPPRPEAEKHFTCKMVLMVHVLIVAAQCSVLSQLMPFIC